MILVGVLLNEKEFMDEVKWVQETDTNLESHITTWGIPINCVQQEFTQARGIISLHIEEKQL